MRRKHIYIVFPLFSLSHSCLNSFILLLLLWLEWRIEWLSSSLLFFIYRFFFLLFSVARMFIFQLDWNRVVCAWTKNQHVYTIRQTTIHWLISSCVYHFYYIQRVFSCFLFHLFLFRCRTAWVVTELRLQRTFELLSNSANESQRKNNLMKAFNYQTWQIH